MLHLNIVWRPFGHPIEDRPLALCDGSTIEDVNLVACDHVTRHYTSETSYMLRSPQQRWYYLAHQTPDEVLFFKNFDADPDVRAKRGCTY